MQEEIILTDEEKETLEKVKKEFVSC